MDDSIRRAQAGEESAFREIFATHREAVARIVFRIMGPSSDIEDVVQDVFIHIYRSLGSFRGDAKFTTWLYRVTVNVTRMHLRKGKSRPRFVDVPTNNEPVADGDAEARPDQMVDRGRRLQALHRLVEALSEKKRTVLVLHDFEGMSPTEISSIVEAPVLTVRTRLFYARKELYAAIAADPDLGPQVQGLLEALPGKPGSKGTDPNNPEVSSI